MAFTSETFLRPYLSIVVASRNDNHGGDLLKRMQIFVTTLLKQCRKYKLSAELIIVEWNPPGNAPPLELALDFSEKSIFCPVRIITVPNEYHKQLAHSDNLTLFQMIAKNVGIRRARGEFVLATNVDVILSSRLMRFLSRRALKEKTLYRIDRTDVKNDIPVTAGLRSIERYCRKNIIRICTRTEIICSNHHTALRLRSIFLNYLPRHYIFIDNKIRSVLPWLPAKKHWLELFRYKTYNKKNIRIVTNHLKRAVKHYRSSLELKRLKQLEDTGARTNSRLHTNACGDFTLLARQDWLDLQGNAEWEMFSFHLDSIFLYLADARGLKEQVIKSPARLYHIEHTAGFTPGRGEQMYVRIRKLGIPILTSQDLAVHREEIYKTKRLNPENAPGWGLKEVDLAERIIS
jgi:hypothetical protein